MIPKEAKLVFKGVLFDVYQWEQEMYDGTTATFERLKRKDSVNVLPILEDGKILLTKEQQPGTDVYTTVPGGQIDAGESPEQAGRRELLEETGYTCEKLEKWLVVNPYSKIDWTVTTFIARGCKKIKDQVLESGEKIVPMPVSLDEYIKIAVGDPAYRNVEITIEIIKAMRKKKDFELLKKLLSARIS